MGKFASKPNNSNQSIDIALEEYRHLWLYYNKMLEERRSLFDYFFKTVTLPAAFAGIILFIYKNTSQNSVIDINFSEYRDLIFFLFVAFYLVGLNIHAVYTRESSNAKKYEEAMRSVRAFLIRSCPNLTDALTIDSLRSDNAGFHSLGSTKFWRGMLIPIINSSIAVLACSIFFSSNSMSFAAFVFIISIGVHIVLSKGVETVYSRREVGSN